VKSHLPATQSAVPFAGVVQAVQLAPSQPVEGLAVTQFALHCLSPGAQPGAPPVPGAPPDAAPPVPDTPPDDAPPVLVGSPPDPPVFAAPPELAVCPPEPVPEDPPEVSAPPLPVEISPPAPDAAAVPNDPSPPSKIDEPLSPRS
jgi:periplasmic protein TonB